jgi:hypothetical protein
MLALDFRSLLVTLMLSSAASVPALAGEGTTTQQTVVGQGAIEVAAVLPAKPAVVDQTYATENNGRVATARPRPRAADFASPQPVRQARATYYRPGLILGIGY